MAHGGKREGAGRKQGSLTKRTRALAEQALAEGKAPLEVMLDNMRHFQQVALDAEATIEGLTAEEATGTEMTPDEQFKHLLAQVKKAAGFRIMAHECARDAAPFVHARLSSSTVTINDKRDATDWTRDELVAFLSNARANREGVSEAPRSPTELN